MHNLIIESIILLFRVHHCVENMSRIRVHQVIHEVDVIIGRYWEESTGKVIDAVDNPFPTGYLEIRDSLAYELLSWGKRSSLDRLSKLSRRVKRIFLREKGTESGVSMHWDSG